VNLRAAAAADDDDLPCWPEGKFAAAGVHCGRHWHDGVTGGGGEAGMVGICCDAKSSKGLALTT
jgi:hypothetical protein